MTDEYRPGLTPEEKALADSMRELVKRAIDFDMQFGLPLGRLRRRERMEDRLPRRGTGGLTNMEAYKQKKTKQKEKRTKRKPE